MPILFRKKGKTCPQNEANLAWSRWLWELERLQWFLLCSLGHISFLRGDQPQGEYLVFFGLFPLSWEYPEYFFVGKTTLKGEYQLKYHFQGGFLCIQRFSCQLSGEIIDILETSAEIPCGVWLYFCLMISHPFHNNWHFFEKDPRFH